VVVRSSTGAPQRIGVRVVASLNTPLSLQVPGTLRSTVQARRSRLPVGSGTTNTGATSTTVRTPTGSSSTRGCSTKSFVES
jgi:hypothetical protein